MLCSFFSVPLWPPQNFLAPAQNVFRRRHWACNVRSCEIKAHKGLTNKDRQYHQSVQDVGPMSMCAAHVRRYPPSWTGQLATATPLGQITTQFSCRVCDSHRQGTHIGYWQRPLVRMRERERDVGSWDFIWSSSRDKTRFQNTISGSKPHLFNTLPWCVPVVSTELSKKNNKLSFCCFPSNEKDKRTWLRLIKYVRWKLWL